MTADGIGFALGGAEKKNICSFLLQEPSMLAPATRRARLRLAALAMAVVGCESLQWGALRVYLAANPHLEVADGPRAYRSATGEALWLVPIRDGLEFPWDVAFLSEREALVTEKPGRLSRIDLATGDLRAIAGVPDVAFVGQGGLLGVEADPEFAENRWLYLSYSIAVEPDAYTTRLARARLRGDRLVDFAVLLSAQPARAGENHFGGALAFDRAGLLYLSVGERDERDFAQDLGTHLGKILRLRPDGSIPDDNPFVVRAGAEPSIYSWGHRNPQGLALDPATGAMWSAEHGPQGGDEINVLRAGRNYGWPIVSYGEEYGGGKIGVGTHREDFEPPVHYYTPSIAPSGIAFYTGDALPGWNGSLFVAALRLTHLNRLAIEGERVTHEERLFGDLWHRVRNVAQSPFTGELFVLTENGTLFRIDPART
jgi:glucose/arabinose dehydrogenase